MPPLRGQWLTGCIARGFYCIFFCIGGGFRLRRLVWERRRAGVGQVGVDDSESTALGSTHTEAWWELQKLETELDQLLAGSGAVSRLSHGCRTG